MTDTTITFPPSIVGEQGGQIEVHATSGTSGRQVCVRATVPSGGSQVEVAIYLSRENARVLVEQLGEVLATPADGGQQ